MSTPTLSSRPALLFDLDGTLVDSVYQHVLAWRQALEAVGIELSVWRIHRRIGMSGGLFLKALDREVGRTLSTEEADKLRQSHAKRYLELWDQVRPLPGARDLLSTLTGMRVPWAIATSGSQATAKGPLSLLGIPYRWGGTTRAGFDCSGFTQHVWAAAGVKIPRTVSQQAEAGTPVPLNRAQPGDLVVFYPNHHHVGIYIGNNMVVDSPHTGSWVRTDPIRSMPVSVVVRPHI